MGPIPANLPLGSVSEIDPAYRQTTNDVDLRQADGAITHNGILIQGTAGGPSQVFVQGIGINVPAGSDPVRTAQLIINSLPLQGLAGDLNEYETNAYQAVLDVYVGGQTTTPEPVPSTPGMGIFGCEPSPVEGTHPCGHHLSWESQGPAILQSSTGMWMESLNEGHTWYFKGVMKGDFNISVETTNNEMPVDVKLTKGMTAGEVAQAIYEVLNFGNPQPPVINGNTATLNL
jgi:hypothetical protein